jgi:hypothetical protein
MNSEPNTIEMLIQGGAVGITILMIGYTFAKDKMYNKTLNNHLEHFTSALDRNSEIIGSNTEVVKSNCKMLERIENHLDKR